ncbi:MAG: AMIN domain-containing protein [Thermodesulfobacteriota bacterium]
MSVLIRKRSVACARPALTIPLVLACVMLLAAPHPCHSNASMHILGIDVAPDLSKITVRADGPTAKPKAFALPKPNRLVLDFEASKLGPVAGKIRVDKEPIREIRLGATDAKVRVVVDFGDHPVPPHRVSLQGNHVLVELRRTLEKRGPGPSEKEHRIKNAPATTHVAGAVTKEARPKLAEAFKPAPSRVTEVHRPKPIVSAKAVSPDPTRQHGITPVSSSTRVSAEVAKEAKPKPAETRTPVSLPVTEQHKSRLVASSRPVASHPTKERVPVPASATEPVPADMPKGLSPEPDDAAQPAAPETSHTSGNDRPQETHPAGLAVKEAGAAQDLVYLKLSDRNNPQRSYRVILEVDPARLRLVKGSMSDDRGRLNAFRFEADGPEYRAAGHAPDPDIEERTKKGSGQRASEGPEAISPPRGDLPKQPASEPAASAPQGDPVKVQVRRPAAAGRPEAQL